MEALLSETRFYFSALESSFHSAWLAYMKEIMIILMILNSSFDLFPPQANQNTIWVYEMIHL